MILCYKIESHLKADLPKTDLDVLVHYYQTIISVKELVSIHDKHLTRPTLDDNVDEEHAIEIQTQEITQVSELQDSCTKMSFWEVRRWFSSKK